MTNVFHLKLNQPKELPQDGLTSVQFKPWRNHLLNFLQQDIENYRFLPGGEYAVWKAAVQTIDGLRIDELKDTDSELGAIEGAAGSVQVKDQKKQTLKLRRNSQLSKLIQHVASFVFYTEADDINESSTSLDWVFNYLKEHYNIQAKGANFLKITENVYNAKMLPQVFYKQLKASFVDNLRKQGEKAKGGIVLQADETLSPSFEDTIVLWALEKINPRLPAKVRKDYEHRLSGDTYLVDLQPTIFQSIPSMLQELDREVDASSVSISESEADTSLGSLRFNQFNRQKRGGRGGRSDRGRGGQTDRGRGGQTGRSGQDTYERRHCRVCQAAGKPSQVYKTHNVGTCGFFNRQDRQDMLSALQAMSVEDQQGDEGQDEANWTIEEEELESND